MANVNRIRRKQALREAEGYLDLVMALSDRFALSPDVRDRVAKRSIDTLDRFGDFGPRHSHALYLRGEAFRLMECNREAIESLEKSAELDRENLRTWLALGWCYKRIKRLDLAIQSLEEALGIDSGEAIVHYNLACYWSLAQNAKIAIEYLAEAFAIDPAYRELVPGETDFDNIRHEPDFKMLTSTLV